MPKLQSSTATKALVGIYTVSLTAFIIATLYLAREVLIPLALAALVAFLLAPLVTRVERWVGRVAGVLLVVALILTATGAASWVLSKQLVDLATKLPDYKENIQAKLRTFKVPSGGRFTRLSQAVEDLKKDLPGSQPRAVPPAAEKAESSPAAKPAVNPAVIPVQVVESSRSNPIHLVERIIAPLLGPLGTAALVLLLVIFILLKREDLRSRLIRLIGQGRISATTRVMDDAGNRVTHYLLMQLTVNVSYGLAVGIGLYFIGVPNAVLWGACAAVLRFIPYIGTWIGAAIPIALSLAVSQGWMMPLCTVSLFVTLELLLSNFMEPWIYGSSTGVTPFALIVAAVFWTWLWGPVGLILATPMTVCLVVMGRHVPRLSFLRVLLSDEEALTPAEDFYYRLLTVGEQDEMELVETYLKANSLAALYDSVFIPVITAAEIDSRLERIDGEQRSLIEQALRDMVADLNSSSRVSLEQGNDQGTPAPAERSSCRIYCLPARAVRDELAGTMLQQLLGQQGLEAQATSTKLDADESIALIEQTHIDVACISVVAPSTVLHARYLCLKLRALRPKLKIVVGLWGATENVTDATRRVRDSGADEVVTTLAEAVLQVKQLAWSLETPVIEPISPPRPPGELPPVAGFNST